MADEMTQAAIVNGSQPRRPPPPAYSPRPQGHVQVSATPLQQVHGTNHMYHGQQPGPVGAGQGEITIMYSNQAPNQGNQGTNTSSNATTNNNNNNNANNTNNNTNNNNNNNVKDSDGYIGWIENNPTLSKVIWWLLQLVLLGLWIYGFVAFMSWVMYPNEDTCVVTDVDVIEGDYACDGSDEYFVAVDLETDNCGEDTEVSMFSDCYDSDSDSLSSYYYKYYNYEQNDQSFTCYVDNDCEFADDSEIIGDVWIFWLTLVLEILSWIFTVRVSKKLTFKIYGCC